MEGLFTLLLVTLAIPRCDAQYTCHRGNYPVIVYDASTRNAWISTKWAAEQTAPSFPFQRYTPAAAPMLFPSGLPVGFLCDGRPVEVYIINRRLKTSFTVSLTTTFQPPAATLDIRGVPPAAPAAATPAPASKGFTSNAANNTSLLTTDQVIALFLNDETFDKAYTRVTDDASDVLAQADQLQANTNRYVETLYQFIGLPADAQPSTPLDRASLAGVAGSWQALANAVNAAVAAAGPVPPPPLPTPVPITEFTFDDWINRADRLETEVQSLNAKMQAYPIADTITNLQASRLTLRDNYNDVLSERDAINRAIQLLRDLLPVLLPGENPPRGVSGAEWRQRQVAEVRLYLRQHYTGTAISDPTLARIVEDFSSLRLNKLAALDDIPYCAQPPRPDGPIPAFAAPQNRYCDMLARLDERAAPPVIADKLHSAEEYLNQTRNAVVALNQTEGTAMREINSVYDNFYAPMEVLNLGLGGSSGNLFIYYTINGAEQFNRYQISNELAIPQSNCVLSVAANTNVAGGVTPCTTAANPPIPAPLASFAGAPFPPPVIATAPSSTAPAVTPYAHLTGRVEMHHFSDATLVTGVAYDSVTSPSFSWNTCPTDPNNTPAGNYPSSAHPACISPTTPAGSTTSTPPYYQLISTKQAPVAAVQGVDIFFKRQDQFPTAIRPHSVGAFIGVAAYPLNHYFFGLSGEPKPGFNLTAGAVVGSINVLPDSFGYQVGSYSTANPTVPSATRFKVGFFVMFGFDTSLFKSIFNLSAFQGTGLASVVGAPTSTAVATQ